jgi:hypothetical protein
MVAVALLEPQPTNYSVNAQMMQQIPKINPIIIEWFYLLTQFYAVVSALKINTKKESTKLSIPVEE